MHIKAHNTAPKLQPIDAWAEALVHEDFLMMGHVRLELACSGM